MAVAVERSGPGRGERRGVPPVSRKRTTARAAVIPFPSTAGAIVRAAPSGRTLLVVAVGVAAAFGAYAVARASPLFALDRIEIRGAPGPLEGQVRHALAPLEGESLLAFRAGRADTRLAALSEVAGASYDRAFPHTLVVTIQPEYPVAVLRQGADGWLAAASGRVLATQPAGARPKLPRIWLPAETNVVVGRALADAAGIRALRTLWGSRRAGFRARIRFVRTNSQELTLITRTGVEIRLGDRGRLALKLAIAARLLPEVGTPVKAPAYLDLSVPERPVASANNPQVTS